MASAQSNKHVDAIAREADVALASGQQVQPFSDRVAGFDLASAYAVTAALRNLRLGRGETHAGRKIGFSNRGIWAEYGVFAPIWGDMYASTVADLKDGPNTFRVGAMPEPRIEPEIAFGLAAAPRAGMDEAALLDCIDWVAHGYEIVVSIFPGWRFAASDVVAAGGVHGALMLGARHVIKPADRKDWLGRLAAFEIELSRDGEPIDRGHARNVLDGPLSALRHLVELLADDRHNPPLRGGEIITTGTVTRAFPIAPGERWTTRVIGLPLEGIDVAFT